MIRARQVFDDDGWIVAEGLPHDRLARVMHFIQFANRTRLPADQAKYISHGPARSSSQPSVGRDRVLQQAVAVTREGRPERGLWPPTRPPARAGCPHFWGVRRGPQTPGDRPDDRSGDACRRGTAAARQPRPRGASALIGSLLPFILITVVMPIADMLFRLVENQMCEKPSPALSPPFGRCGRPIPNWSCFLASAKRPCLGRCSPAFASRSARQSWPAPQCLTPHLSCGQPCRRFCTTGPSGCGASPGQGSIQSQKLAESSVQAVPISTAEAATRRARPYMSAKR